MVDLFPLLRLNRAGHNSRAANLSGMHKLCARVAIGQHLAFYRLFDLVLYTKLIPQVDMARAQRAYYVPKVFWYGNICIYSVGINLLFLYTLVRSM